MFIYNNKIKKIKLPRCRNNSKIKFVERRKFDTSNASIHDRSLYCLCTGTSIKMVNTGELGKQVSLIQY